MEFGNYWFEAGTPTSFVELLKRDHYDLRRLTHEQTSVDILNSIDSASTNSIPVIYIMEFKLEGTAEEAIRQIDEKKYAQPFAMDTCKLFKIGVNFSNKTRNIEKWIIE